MVLLEITPSRKHLTALRFSEEYLPEGAKLQKDGLIYLDSDFCVEKKLAKGTNFTEEEIDELYLESEKRRAKSKALWLLSRRDYPSGLLQKKLKETFAESAADYAVCRMVELGLVNDLAYAKALAESLIKYKGIAPRQAPYVMAEKGVDLGLAKEVLAERDDDPKESIKHLVETKYLRKLSEPKGNEKVFAALVRKGFGYSDIRSVLEQYTKEEFFSDY